MRSVLVAVQFLTVLPWPEDRAATAEEIGRSSVFFPLVGFFLGVVLLLFKWLLDPYLPSAILSVVLVGLLVFSTGALHLDGLGDTFDGLGAKGGREEALKAMRDSRTGVFGVLAVVLVVILKVRAIELLEAEQALLVAPVLGRWAMVILAHDSTAAHEGLGTTMVEHVSRLHLFVATAIALSLAAGLSGTSGILIALPVSILTLLSKGYFHRRLGGVTGDIFGAVGELAETLAFVLFASLS